MPVTPPRDPFSASSLAVEDLTRELRYRVYRFLMRLRFAIAPLPLLLGCIVVVFDPTLWRRIVIVGALGTAAVLSILEERAVRSGRRAQLEPPLVVIGSLQVSVMFATGGVMSPVVMAMLMVGFVASAMLERRLARTLVAAEIASVWLAAGLELTGLVGTLLPLPFRSSAGAAPAPLFVVVLLLVETTIFLVTLEMGSRIRVAFAELLGRVTAARDESLQTQADRLEELTRLSGEIAHELKNPLASIKGLAALLARRANDEQGEQLGVLRSEADRMQATLDDFLNFSRPLVPLATRETDLGALVGEVCTLLEGQLAQQELRVEVDGAAASPLTVRADPRKVQQILVNVLQNAIEASPAGSTIGVALAAAGDAVQVTITDAGPGLAPGLAGRVFEPGVTTKPKGSGFGLKVARGLVRQHGGELTLTSPAEGGCVASLRLPYAPPSIEAEAAP